MCLLIRSQGKQKNAFICHVIKCEENWLLKNSFIWLLNSLAAVAQFCSRTTKKGNDYGILSEFVCLGSCLAKKTTVC